MSLAGGLFRTQQRRYRCCESPQVSTGNSLPKPHTRSTNPQYPTKKSNRQTISRGLHYSGSLVPLHKDVLNDSTRKLKCLGQDTRAASSMHQGQGCSLAQYFSMGSPLRQGNDSLCPSSSDLSSQERGRAGGGPSPPVLAVYSKAHQNRQCKVQRWNSGTECEIQGKEEMESRSLNQPSCFVFYEVVSKSD